MKTTLLQRLGSSVQASALQRTSPRYLGIVAFVMLTSAALAQNADSTQTLIVNGQQSNVAVVQLKGRTYVALEALARVVGGSISYAGNQTSLTIPTSGSNGATAATTTATPAASSAVAPSDGLSRSFLNAGIEEAATLREWHAALGSAIRNGYPITADTFTGFRTQSQTNLRLASVAVTNDSDRGAYQLLAVLFQNMSTLSDRYVERRANMTYISPDSLEKDALNQRIVACGHSLSAMAASGQFYDDGSCQ